MEEQARGPFWWLGEIAQSFLRNSPWAHSLCRRPSAGWTGSPVAGPLPDPSLELRVGTAEALLACPNTVSPDTPMPAPGLVFTQSCFLLRGRYWVSRPVWPWSSLFPLAVQVPMMPTECSPDSSWQKPYDHMLERA